MNSRIRLVGFLGVSVLLASMAASLGCGGKKGGGTPGIDVAGQVLNNIDAPVANAQVLVNGVLTTTDSAGNFAVSNVTTPYTIALNDTPASRIVVNLGVTIPNPRLRSGASIVAHSATLSGTLTPTAASGDGLVAAGNIPLGLSVPPTGLNSFSVQAYWYDASSTSTAKLTAVRYTTGVDAMVNSIASYGTLDVPVQNGVAQTNLSIALSPVSTGATTVSFQLPAGYSADHMVGVAIDPAGAVFLPLGQTTASNATFTDVTDSGFLFGVAGYAVPTGASGFSQGISVSSVVGNPSGTAIIPIAELPAVTAPASGATLAAGDAVAWTPGLTGSGFVLGLQPQSSGTAIVVNSDSASITLPDLSAFGAVAGSTQYTLIVQETKPSPTVDEALDPGFTAASASTQQFAISAPLDVTASF